MTNKLPAPAPDDGGDFLLYQTDDGSTRIEVRMADENVWLSQKDMAELFRTTPQNITQHLATIYEEGELTEAATCKEYLQVRSEGKRQVQRSLKHYNLDAIISVGYRVRSRRGTQFRIWATQARPELYRKNPKLRSRNCVCRHYIDKISVELFGEDGIFTFTRQHHLITQTAALQTLKLSTACVLPE
ncbi:hypothetical protein EC9_37910 [Rosistilla ulvae]|uniref:Bro-N domain-containing protein n=1 Tax=Rosistilla ulvae TaxID=1930277 RepID=A0A517M3Z3_9BACT|nr:RhuM family protein [Rosistilla ulvae]QDS89591.1 hypothetical protein EC9_37910 [Rosistilla ulvae]